MRGPTGLQPCWWCVVCMRMEPRGSYIPVFGSRLAGYQGRMRRCGPAGRGVSLREGCSLSAPCLWTGMYALSVCFGAVPVFLPLCSMDEPSKAISPPPPPPLCAFFHKLSWSWCLHSDTTVTKRGS